MTGKPEVVGSSFGLVPTNALMFTAVANFRVVGKPQSLEGHYAPKSPFGPLRRADFLGVSSSS